MLEDDDEQDDEDEGASLNGPCHVLRIGTGQLLRSGRNA